MGNSSISEIADPIWNLFKDLVPVEQIQEKTEQLLKIFESQDWDCQDEAEFIQNYFEYKDGWIFNKEFLDKPELDNDTSILRSLPVWKKVPNQDEVTDEEGLIDCENSKMPDIDQCFIGTINLVSGIEYYYLYIDEDGDLIDCHDQEPFIGYEFFDFDYFMILDITDEDNY